MSDTAVVTKVDVSDPWVGMTYLERARHIAPIIEAEAEKIEAEGRLTPTVIEALRESQLFWMLVPKDLGGGGLSVVEAVEATEEIARADGSAGWCLMASAFGSAIAVGYLPAEGARRMFGGDDKALLAGASAPVGTASPTEGGYTINGKWQFASGSEYANWVGVGLHVLDEHGKPKYLDNGNLDMRWGCTPRENVEFLGNWNVSGLVGTGSQDYSVENVFLPEDSQMSTFSLSPVRSEGLFYMGLLGLSVGGHFAVANGVMQRALSEVARIADGKKRVGYPSDVSDYPVFQYEFVRHEAAYQSARAYGIDVLGEAEEYAAREGSLTPEHLARIRQSTTHAHHVMHDVVSFAHLWGGTQSIRNPSFLGRAMRDAHVMSQHLLVDNIALVEAAPALLDVWKNQ